MIHTPSDDFSLYTSTIATCPLGFVQFFILYSNKKGNYIHKDSNGKMYWPAKRTYAKLIALLANDKSRFNGLIYCGLLCFFVNICKLQNDEIKVIMLPKNVDGNRENIKVPRAANQNPAIQK